MKRNLIALFLLVGVFLTGCGRITPGTGTTLLPNPSIQTTPNTTQATTGAPLPGADGNIGALEKIWLALGEDQHFAVYGGAMEHPVDGAPGALDLSNTEELTTKYLMPQSVLADVTEGASLVHMMNGNIFTSAVVSVSGDLKETAKAWRDAIQQNTWICGQPDRILLTDLGEGRLLMVFAAQDIMETFQAAVTQAFPQSKVLLQEAVAV